MTSTVEQQAFQSAATMLKVQGIIAIIFGALGSFFGLLLMLIFGLALGATSGTDNMITMFVYFLVSMICILAPSVYFIVSGVILVRHPAPKLARILTIINLVLGALINYVVLAFAIVSLVKDKDYEAGYTTKNLTA